MITNFFKFENVNQSNLDSLEEIISYELKIPKINIISWEESEQKIIELSRKKGDKEYLIKQFFLQKLPNLKF